MAQGDRIPTLVFERALVLIGIARLAAIIEIFRADMQRLMNVAREVREQDDSDGLRHLPLVLLRRVAFENGDAVAHRMNDVPLTAPSLTVRIFLWAENRDVGVVKPVMRGDHRMMILRRRIRFPIRDELRIDPRPRGVMKDARRIGTVLVPALDLISDYRRFLQG